MKRRMIKLFILFLFFVLVFELVGNLFNFGRFPFHKSCEPFMMINRHITGDSNDRCIIQLMEQGNKRDLSLYYYKTKFNLEEPLSELDEKAIKFLNRPGWKIIDIKEDGVEKKFLISDQNLNSKEALLQLQYQSLTNREF